MHTSRAFCLLVFASLLLFGCQGDNAIQNEMMEEQDASTGQKDQGSLPQDMSEGKDAAITIQPDMFTQPDLAQPAQDMSVPQDLSTAQDQGQLPQDLSIAPDLNQPEDMAPSGPWNQFSNRWTSIDLGTTLTQRFTLSFEMEAGADQIDAVIGLGANVASQYDDLATIVRLSNTGAVDARSGNDYLPLAPALGYTAKQPLFVQMEVRPQSKNYTVTVTSPSGTKHAQTTLAFRTSQQQNDTFQFLSVYAGDGDASIRDIRLDGNLVPWTPVRPPVMRLMDADFDGSTSKGFGQVTRADLANEFGTVAWSGNERHLALVTERGRGRVLRVKYDPKSNGSDRVGLRVTLPPGDERWLSYRVQFEPGFEFVKGGKLPGLAGGAANTGGNKPNGTDGYTSRYMWRRNGELVVYLYHPDQPSIYGEDFSHQGLTLQTGRWYTVRQRVVMNTNNQRNGRLETWVDGQPYLSESIRLRSRDNAFQIDSFLFSTFYGGNDPSWAPSKTTYARFDDFKVATSQNGVD